jgi:DNA-directed RNA polymerase beta subunit
MGENPDDPGGYFIYNGNIRTIPGTEKLRLNRLFISPPSAKVPFARVSQTIVVPTGTAVSFVFEKSIADSQYAKAYHFNVSKMKKDKSDDSKNSKYKNSINVLTLIDILCLLYRRKDILQISATGPHYGVSVIRSLICTKDPELRERQRRDVLIALQGTIMEYKTGVSTEQKIGELLSWLEHDSERETKRQKYDALLTFVTDQIFWSVPITKTVENDEIIYNIEGKIRSICLLTCQFLLYKTGHETITDKDNWENKKVDSAIVGMGQYFWSEYQKLLSSRVKRTSVDQVRTFENAINFSDSMVPSLTSAFLAPFNKPIEEGTTGSAFEPSQTVNPTNLVHLISEVTKIQVAVNKKVKSEGVRSIQGSQYGYICPAQTPDGIKCGMVKRKSILSHITIYSDPTTIVDFCIKNGFVKSEPSLVMSNVFIVNEKIIGWCDADVLKEIIVRLKEGTPAKYSIKKKNKTVNIQSAWYSFDVKRAVVLAFADLKENIRVDDEANQDGYKLELFIDGKFFSHINERILSRLKFLSALPRIHKDTTMLLDQFGRFCIYTDAGRLMRVVYNVRDNRQYNRLFRDSILPNFELLVDTEAYSAKGLSFSQLEERGFVQYIDAYEESDPAFYYAFDKKDFYEKIRADEKQIRDYNENIEVIRILKEEIQDLTGSAYAKASVKLQVLEAEVEFQHKVIQQASVQPVRCVGLNGVGMYGVAATYGPVSHHDPASKTVHTSKTIVQTLGLESSRYAHRKQESLMASNIPLAPPSITAQFGDRRSFLGRDVALGLIDLRDNQEDALLFSSHLLDLGFVQYMRKFTIETEINISAGLRISQYLGISSTIPPERRIDYSHLTEYGLPPINYLLKEGQIAIAKYEIDKEREVPQLIPVIVEPGDAGRVIDVIINTIPAKGGGISTKVRVSLLIEAVYKPEVGDKFSFMHGQKSVVGGRIIPQTDMPFDVLTGTSPLVLLNTHAIKNRQTMGLILEQVLGMRAALFGKAQDTTGFVPHVLAKYIKELNENGFAFIATTFINGTRGTFYPGFRFTGYARLQQLHHFAHKKISVMGYAGTEAITTQRMKSAKAGGEKMGEMEKNVIIAYGMWGYFMEKFRIHSDNYTAYACKSCEFFNHIGGLECPHCGERDSLLLVEVPGSLEYLKRIARAQGLQIKSSIGTAHEFAESIVNFITSKDNMANYQNYIAVDDNEEEDLVRMLEEEEEFF